MKAYQVRGLGILVYEVYGCRVEDAVCFRWRPVSFSSLSCEGQILNFGLGFKGLGLAFRDAGRDVGCLVSKGLKSRTLSQSERSGVLIPGVGVIKVFSSFRV